MIVDYIFLNLLLLHNMYTYTSISLRQFDQSFRRLFRFINLSSKRERENGIAESVYTKVVIGLEFFN